MKSDIALLRYTCQLREGECKTKLGKPISVKHEAEHDKCILFWEAAVSNAVWTTWKLYSLGSQFECVAVYGVFLKVPNS